MTAEPKASTSNTTVKPRNAPNKCAAIVLAGLAIGCANPAIRAMLLIV